MGGIARQQEAVLGLQMVAGMAAKGCPLLLLQTVREERDWRDSVEREREVKSEGESEVRVRVS